MRTIRSMAYMPMIAPIALLAALASFITSGTRVAAATIAAIGKPAPSFSLTNVLTNDTVSLEGLLNKRKATVVMFIATRCPVSNAYNDRMVALASKFEPEGVAFVGINSNATEPAAECADHATQHHFNFPVVKDPGCAVADSYDAHHTPTVYVIDGSGVLVYEGRIDDSMDPSNVTSHDLADALDSVLAGKPIAHPVTKAFGCSIKRSVS